MIAAVALGALLLGGPAEPATPTRDAGPAAVSLAIDDCPDVPREPLARLLGLELDAPVLPPEQVGEHAVHVQVGCTGATVRIAVDDPRSGTQLRRAAVFPPEHEDVVVRLVALAIAELVLTRQVTPSFEDAPAARVEAVVPAAPPPALEPARSTGRAEFLVLGQALGPFSGVGMAWGGGLRLGWAFGRRWVRRRWVQAGPAVEADLAAAETNVERALGTVQVVLWSATLRASLRLRVGRAWLDLGGGGRAGLAQLQGQPGDASATRGGSAVGAWAGPIGYAGIGAHFGHLAVALGIEGGRVLRPVSGIVDAGSPVAIDGNWACATIAAGWGE